MIDFMENSNSVPIVLHNQNGKFAVGHPKVGGKHIGSRHFQTLFNEAVRKVADGNHEADDVLIVKKVINKAKEGNLQAVEIILDRVDGAIPKPQGDAGGEPFVVNLIVYEDNRNSIQLHSPTISTQPTESQAKV